MPNPCNTKVTAAGDNLNNAQAEELLQIVKNRANMRAEKKGIAIGEAIKEIAGEIKAEEKTMALIYQRNQLMDIQKKRSTKDFSKRFTTMGEGLRAFLVGSNKLKDSARKSIGAQSDATYGKYFGRLYEELDQAGVLRDFKHMDDDLKLNVYKEMGNMHPGQPAKQVTKDPRAFKIAQIVDGVTEELVARQNRAGAYIRRMPGYITRQTHDMTSIRALGKLGNNPVSKNESYKSWSTFVLPLLDHERTFQGADAEKVMRNIHEALYSGIHGVARDETDVSGALVRGSLAGKLSKERVLHFKDAESAFKYNQALGIKDFKESLLHDIHVRTRSIAMMENLGTRPEQNFEQIVRELQEEARTLDDGAKHLDSLQDWRIKAAFNEITGKNEVSSNPNLSNIMGTGKVLLQTAKMGSVVLSAFSDRAFMHSEMAAQAMSNLGMLGESIRLTVHKSKEQQTMLRYMGVAMDGIMGNALSRYSSHSSTSGWAHELQKKFFDMNGLNLWTDANKGAMGLLMSHHLGDHAALPFKELPQELSNMLSLYDITPSRWEALRSHVVDHEGIKHILPESSEKIPKEIIASLVTERGLNPTDVNILRERDALDTALRTYFHDRINTAIPTPGAGERMYATWGTQAGTPLGEAVRLLMMFKSFPITVMNKVLGRTIYGRGSDSVGQFLLHDHKGKFNFAMLVAMSTVAGYVSGVVRDGLKGRTPKPLLNDDGSIHWNNVNDAAVRGGGLGLLGDFMLTQYDHQYRSFLEGAAGPALSQLNTVFALKNQAQQGKPWADGAEKLILDNTPLINLFYIRPALDYFVLWQLQEATSPGSLRRMESAVQQKTGQEFFIKPSETINK